MARVDTFLSKRQSNNIETRFSLSPETKKHKIHQTNLDLNESLNELFPVLSKHHNCSILKPNSPLIKKLSKHIGYMTLIYSLVTEFLDKNKDINEILCICHRIYIDIQDKIIETSLFLPHVSFNFILTKINQYFQDIHGKCIDCDRLNAISESLPQKFESFINNICNQISNHDINNVFSFKNSQNLNFDMRMSKFTNSDTSDQEEDLFRLKEDKDIITFDLQFDQRYYSLWNIFYTLRQLHIMHFIPEIYNNIKFLPSYNLSSVTLVSKKYIFDHIFSTIPLILSLKHLRPICQDSEDSNILFREIHIGPFARKITNLFLSNKRFNNWLAVRFLSVLFTKDNRRDTMDIGKTLPEYSEQLKPFIKNLVNVMYKIDSHITVNNMSDYLISISGLIDLNNTCQCITMQGIARLITIFNNCIHKQDDLNQESKERLLYLKYIIEDTLYPSRIIKDNYVENIRKSTIENQIRTYCIFMQGDFYSSSTEDRYDKEGIKLWTSDKKDIQHQSSKHLSKELFYDRTERDNLIKQRNEIIQSFLRDNDVFPLSYTYTRYGPEINYPQKLKHSRCTNDTQITLLDILSDDSICNSEDAFFIFCNIYDMNKSTEQCKTLSLTKYEDDTKNIFRNLKQYHQIKEEGKVRDTMVSPMSNKEQVLTNHIARIIAYRYLYNQQLKNKNLKISDDIVQKTMKYMIEPMGEKKLFFTKDDSGKFKKIQYVIPTAVRPPDGNDCFLFNSTLDKTLGELILIMNELDYIISLD